MSDTLLDRSKPIRAGEELDRSALDAYLSRALPELRGELVVEQFPGGFSNLTYLLRKGETELVLRRPPVGSQVKSGHDMGREYRVLAALHPVYPAPRPLAYCEAEDVIGAPFYVMERQRGLIVRRSMPDALRDRPELFGSMCASLVDGLAALHAVDYEAVGLGDLGRPQGYVARQVEGWLRRWEKAKTSEVPDIDEIGRWLVENMPSDSGATIVHNDYKFDNVILDVDDPTRIVAVLDWEMCTLGDPLMDLGTTVAYWVEPQDDPMWRAMAFSPTTLPGAYSRRGVVERYAAQTGRDVSNMLYYYCFALLKIAVIAQQIFYRHHHGYTKDPRFAPLDQVVAALGRISVAAAESGRYSAA